MKRIAIDITHFNKLSGYGTVTRNIVKGILEKDKDNVYYLLSNTNIDLSLLKGLTNYEFINTKEGFIRYKFFSLSKHLKDYKIDIFFSLDQTLPFKKVCKYIVIEHDIGFQRIGRFNLIKFFFQKKIKLTRLINYFIDLERFHLCKADKIICPSEFTKNEITNYYKLDASKIKSIYWGIDHIKENITPVQKRNYILFLWCNDYKNGFTYKLAEKIIEKNLIDKVIILKGNKLYSDNSRIKIIQGYISDKEKDLYIQESLLNVYYSHYDGFGFFPLESMVYKTPVLVNKSSSLQEVLGDGTVTVNEDDYNEWLKEIDKLINDKNEYSIQIQRGLKTANKYLWKNTVDEVLGYVLD